MMMMMLVVVICDNEWWYINDSYNGTITTIVKVIMIMTLEGAVLDFQTLLSASRTVYDTHTDEAKALSLANHV